MASSSSAESTDFASSAPSAAATTKTVQLISSQFPFDLDDFQTDALYALCTNQSVVLSAPTGAGKTVIGEMAVYLALCRNMRLFYTTPLKALSNQKYYDFSRQFGASRVGLLTGDVTVNRDAPIIVMTTEIYRNMLYAEATERSEALPLTEGLYAVVFDEFHYLNDQERGTVWEESVINSPPHVVLVALSATMSNAEQVRDWFSSAQGPTSLVQSSIRPVPLKFGFCDHEGLIPIFADDDAPKSDKKTKGFSKSSKDNDKAKKKNEAKMHPKLLRKLKALKDLQSGGRRSSRNSLNDWSDDDDENTRRKLQRIVSRNSRRERFSGIPSYPFVVRSLRKRDMLPGIVFIFSRAGCDKAAMMTLSEREDLVTSEERSEIQKRLDAFVKENPNMVQPDRLRLAASGIASHHAGLLPLWKVCVEELFQDGLIKVVFATETLAAGINMPARTTVISSLSKRAGEEGIRLLTTSEVLQMAGRAGRRGKDVVGHSLVLRSRNEGALEAFKVLTQKVDALESKFTPKYGMVLNLLLTRPLQEAKRLVDRSFGNFLRLQERSKPSKNSKKGSGGNNSDVDLETLRKEKQALLSVLQDARALVNTVDEAELLSLVKAIERVKAEKRALTYLVQQSNEIDGSTMQDALTFAPVGTRLLLLERRKPSNGAERRRKRRDYAAALEAAGNGDEGAELRSFYLSGDDEEMQDLEGENDSDITVIEAVLLDLHIDNSSRDVSSMFLAVDANGQLRLFSYSAVSQVLVDEEALDVDAIAPFWGDVVYPPRSSWRSISFDQYSSSLPSMLEGIVSHVQKWRDERNESGLNDLDVVSVNTSEEIEVQRGRVEDAKSAALKLDLCKHDNIGMILAARRSISKIEATVDGSVDPLGGKKRKRRGGDIGRYSVLQKEDNPDNGAVLNISEDDNNSSWDEFMSLVEVLQHYGFVDEDHTVTTLGEMAAKVRTENELWTSVVLLDPDLGSVSPVHLGAILGATQMDGGSGRGDSFVEREPSPEVMDFMVRLDSMRTRMIAVQAEFGAEVGVTLDPELMGLVELWASGVTWIDLLRATSLQEGDVCRILRRTLDVVRQVVHLPGVSAELKRNARRAIALLDRFPITDDRTYWISDSEKLDASEEDE